MEFGDYRNSLEENYRNILKEFSDFEGLEDLMKSILDLRDSEIYEKTLLSYNKVEPYDSEVDMAKMVKKLVKENYFFKLANDNLSHFPLSLPPLTNLIDFAIFSTVHMFLEFLYYRETERLLNNNDLAKIDSGMLDARVLFALDGFDTASNVLEPKPEFFKKLKKMKWTDKRTQKLFKKLTNIKNQILYEKWDNNDEISKSEFRETQLAVFEGMILLTLAGSSAAVNGRTKIVWNDIKTAYKTYFKLLNSDVTKLV